MGWAWSGADGTAVRFSGCTMNLRPNVKMSAAKLRARVRQATAGWASQSGGVSLALDTALKSGGVVTSSGRCGGNGGL
jgi:hypothetical protein